ncbi:MAG: endopeptidase La, partial [Myxococcota bacterium]
MTSATSEPAATNTEAPREEPLIILPLRNAVVFPGTVAPVTLGRQSGILAVEEAMKNERPVGLVAQRDPEKDTPAGRDLYPVGTSADILRMMVTDDGERHVLFRGRERFLLVEMLQEDPFLTARCRTLPTHVDDSTELRARMLLMKEQALRAVSLLPRPMPGLRAVIEGIDDAEQLTDLMASTLDIPVAAKQAILETSDINRRVQLVTEQLINQIEILDLTRKIGQETRGALEKGQREFFLREQLKAIQKELGDAEDRGAELSELKEHVEKAGMPPEVQQRVLKEVARLGRLPDASAEYSIIRTYVELLTDLPWSRESESTIDVAAARRILEADHHDLEKVKKRILEYLAVLKLNPSGKSPILCFVGPPGVGKTSLGQSIARATGRGFVRQSLGGIHDESEIRGHRRTYVGAMPGRIIQGIRRAGTRNPVFMLDEVDKLSVGLHGDPSAALLEVLDPEQNHSFEDHYVDAPFDLSKVMFICTANVLDNIPAPLRDRMEVISLPGYTDEDKLHIARKYLIPKERAAVGLAEEQVSFDDAALHEIATSYTREAGVRQLSREIAAICRAVAMQRAEGNDLPVHVDVRSVAFFLGQPRHFNEVALRTSLPGVATALAWTPVGGQILFVEATRMPGEGRLILTGQLGDVMKESAQAALSLVKSRAAALRI